MVQYAVCRYCEGVDAIINKGYALPDYSDNYKRTVVDRFCTVQGSSPKFPGTTVRACNNTALLTNCLRNILVIFEEENDLVIERTRRQVVDISKS